MSKAVKTVFGGTDDSAQKSQKSANSRNIRRIERDTKVAREEAKGLFSASDTNRNMGFQAALDVMGQSIPEQMRAYRQGNVVAQQTLLAGLPQIQNALLGNQIDMTGLEPQYLDMVPTFSQQQLPQFTGSVDALAGNQQQAQAAPNIFNTLRGVNI